MLLMLLTLLKQRNLLLAYEHQAWHALHYGPAVASTLERCLYQNMLVSKQG